MARGEVPTAFDPRCDRSIWVSGARERSHIQRCADRAGSRSDDRARARYFRSILVFPHRWCWIPCVSIRIGLDSGASSSGSGCGRQGAEGLGRGFRHRSILGDRQNRPSMRPGAAGIGSRCSGFRHGEGVAALNLAAAKTLGEPAHALLAGTMGEGVWGHLAA
jgi:hypothetical protein